MKKKAYPMKKNNLNEEELLKFSFENLLSQQRLNDYIRNEELLNIGLLDSLDDRLIDKIHDGSELSLEEIKEISNVLKIDVHFLLIQNFNPEKLDENQKSLFKEANVVLYENYREERPIASRQKN